MSKPKNWPLMPMVKSDEFAQRRFVSYRRARKLLRKNEFAFYSHKHGCFIWFKTYA